MLITFKQFPNSTKAPFLITSPQTPYYNCIAWAYGDNKKWYWPDIHKLYYWPDDIPREEKLENFILLFEKAGFNKCENDQVEAGYTKIAIFCDKNGKPTHAAKQLTNGFWSSKLGQNFDVTHTILAMNGGDYGDATVFMKRKI